MGGIMSWPRFRGRNSMNIRPNYYSGSPDAPHRQSGQLESLDHEVSTAYLSGEIDRMVYGWWLHPIFQSAVAEDTGLTVDQVKAVIDAMLTWDLAWECDGKFHHSANVNISWGKMP